MRGLRQLAAATVALTTALVLLLLTAPPSAGADRQDVAAGSPTSSRTASFVGTDEDYARLEGLPPAGGRRARRASGGSSGPGSGGHLDGPGPRPGHRCRGCSPDARPWRTEPYTFHVRHQGHLGPHDARCPAGESASSGVGGWHKAQRSEELRALLDGLGVLRAASGDRGRPWPGPAHSRNPGSAPGLRPPTRAPRQPARPWWSRAGWAAPPGTRTPPRLRGRRAPPRVAAREHRVGTPTEPRQELLDS